MIAIATIPQLRSLGLVAVVLFLFVWLPYWVFRNWSDVINDLSATYATVIVALLLIAVFGIYLRWDFSSLSYPLVMSGTIEWRDVWYLETLDHIIGVAIIWSTPFVWRRLRLKLAKSLGRTSKSDSLPKSE